MSDEWSKPVKGADGWSANLSPRNDTKWRVGVDATLDAEGLCVVDGFGHDAAVAPRDVVLRLLAAEASDRLGWVWEVGNDPNIGWHASSGESLWGRHASTGRPITADDHFGMNPDELLASLHGAFMLEDALREAGG